MAYDVRDRLRQIMAISRRCLRHIAGYRAGRASLSKSDEKRYFQAIDDAFFELAVLDWCRLFSEPKGKNHWSRVIDNQRRFEWELYQRANQTEPEFLAYAKSVKAARDASASDLEQPAARLTPDLRAARSLVAHLHDHLLAAPSFERYFGDDEKQSAVQVYRQWFRLARAQARRRVDRHKTKVQPLTATKAVASQ